MTVDRRRRTVVAALSGALAVISVGTVVAHQGVGSAQGQERAGELTVALDTGIAPGVPELPGVQGAPPKPVADLVDDEGDRVSFVANELVVSTDDRGALDALLDRWDGELLDTVDLAEAGVSGTPVHLVRVEHVTSDPAPLIADLEEQAPAGDGDFRVSSAQGLGLLTAAAGERLATGEAVSVNWIATPDSVPTGYTTDAPTGAAPNQQQMQASYTPDAFTWPYMSRGSTQDIGVADAWRAMFAAGHVEEDQFGVLTADNRVTIMVMDGGFSFNQDFPSGSSLADGGRNPHPCTNNTPCPWHGTDVVMAGMGLPDNEFGAAGPAGPVAKLVTLSHPGDFFSYLSYPVAFLAALADGPKIINISSSFKADFPFNKGVGLLTNSLFKSLRLAGVLVFASAGNNDKNVDATRGKGIFKHEKATIVPCESSAVICVGGLAWDSTGRHTRSNYGTGSGGTVDMFGPYDVWVGPNPSTRDNPGGLTNEARSVGGTSFSSPFVAGVAALVWAADPSLSADQVEDVLLRTAHTHSPDPLVPRWVNAFAAVSTALGDTPPVVDITTPHEGVEVVLNLERQFRAEAFDAEDGDDCCTVTWTSDQDGTLGTTTGRGAFHALGHTLTSTGTHVITATTEDSAGNRATDSVTVQVANTAPVVSIVSPAAGQELLRDVPVILRAGSFDPNQPGSSLPCDELRWTSSEPGDPLPVRGCEVELSFPSDGTRTLTLTGTDPQGATSAASVTVRVVAPPANLPPVVRIVSPGPDDEVTLRGPNPLEGTADDPEGGAPLGYEWSVTVNGGDPVAIGTGPGLEWDPSETIDFRSGYYEVVLHLRVTDPEGNVGTDSMLIIDAPVIN